MPVLSKNIERAMHQIDAVRKTPLSNKERKEITVYLAALMIEEAHNIQTTDEKHLQCKLKKMLEDEHGKAFASGMADQCFRSHKASRIADQLIHLLKTCSIPSFLHLKERFGLYLFQHFGHILPRLFVPLANYLLRKEMSRVILPGEPSAFLEHIRKRRKNGVRVNLNHLGEAVLGEEEANNRLQTYINVLTYPEVEYISIKITTIYSQIHLLSWEKTLEILAERLRKLYRAAAANLYKGPSGKSQQKFVNLDMEEYRDLSLTVALFKKVLNEPEFFDFSAGIVLQAYLPDSYHIQEDLTQWALERVRSGGAPIKIRIVKGANLAMEQVDSALSVWPQAPYNNKVEVDANYKRMIHYGLDPKHSIAVHIGIGSHNIFDIAYALLLRAENHVDNSVSFEMLEGMADNIRRVIQILSHDMLLYSPVAKKHEFQNAIAYLLRRLDENTGPENFLRHSFDLKVGKKIWHQEVKRFQTSCESIEHASKEARRNQNRLKKIHPLEINSPFKNEANTDWVLEHNQRWLDGLGDDILNQKSPKKIPLVINGKIIEHTNEYAQGDDPSRPGTLLYRNALAEAKHAEECLSCAFENRDSWSKIHIHSRIQLASDLAHEFRKARKHLIALMRSDTGKTITECDVEISEAIDFIEFYRRNLEELYHLEDISWSPKGTILITPPWNFPCAIPVGGIISALLGGNMVIFKPAPEAVWVGWEVAQLFWKVGFSKKVLQFISCIDDPVGSLLVSDKRISTVILTGGTETAKLFMRMRLGIDLQAETGGKNAIIVTGMADRDLAIKDIVSSAFSYAGQKCSAASLLICESEVYNDPNFMRQLRDAAQSLYVGSAWDPHTSIPPIIREAKGALMQGLTQLDPGESWLLEPKQDPNNSRLWSPGIKLGVQPGNFTHMNELFGPMLSVLCARDLNHAIEIVNSTPYGLTSGLHSLDDREHKLWFKDIQAGNLYINRSITGAVVLRQPFGGIKESCFGPGVKPGGPNYLMQMMQAKQIALPKEEVPPRSNIQQYIDVLKQSLFTQEEGQLLQLSANSYTFWWRYFRIDHDPSRLQGQDNILRYLPRKGLVLRLQNEDNSLDLARVIITCVICQAKLELSIGKSNMEKYAKLLEPSFDNISLVVEDDFSILGRIREGKIKRLRLLSQANDAFLYAAAEGLCYLATNPVIANGYLEMLNYLQEISISIDYHRYGSLGFRENETRTPLEKAVSCEQ